MSGRPSGRKLKWKPPQPSYMPANAPLKILQALQNLAAGDAAPHQQKMALQWIITEASGQGTSFRPGGADGARETDFALGRRFVGEQIIGALKIDLVALVEPGSTADNTPPEPSR